MADIGRNLGGAAVDQRLGGVHQRAARIDDVVEQDAAAPFDVADDVHDFALARLGAALVDDGQVGVQAAGQGAGAHHAADVGRDDHQIVAARIVFLDVLRQHGRGHQIVGGNVEEALNLAGVQVHRQDAVGARAGDQIGDQLGRDRGAAPGLTVLTGVAEIGHDGRDPLGRGAYQRVGHDQHFHQVVVGRIRGRLDDEDILAAHVFLDDGEHLIVGETFHLSLSQRHVQVGRNGLGQRPVRIACEQLH